MWLLFCGLAACSARPEKPAVEAEEDFPPESLIIDNVKNTDVSLWYKLLRVTVMPGKDPLDIYGEWKMEAQAVRCFDGALKPGDGFVIFCMFEKGIEPPKAPAEYLGSFKHKQGKEYYVLDNGYWFEYNPQLAAAFQKGAKAKRDK
jgi:hypothetical protein